MKLSFTTLDVFTTTPYTGNPLAIIRVPASVSRTLTEEQKQKIAIEFNLSETVFLHEPTSTDTNADASTPILYDIFTPRARIAFAGHPTIGTAIYLSTHAPSPFPTNPRTKILTTPLVGRVPFSYDNASLTASVIVPHALRQHKTRMPHPLPDPATNPGGLPDCPIVSIVKGMAFILVPLKDLAALEQAGRTGSIVPPADTYKAEFLDRGSGWDTGITNTMYFVEMSEGGEVGRRELRTRVIGRMEDPGTGSASCALAAWLATREGEDGRETVEFRLVQGVEMGRRNDIFVKVTKEAGGAGGLESVRGVELKGSAVKVMEGTLEI